MADAVTSQTLFDGERMAIMKFTNVSDGTGESAVLKVDVSSLSSSASGKACDGVTINKIHASTAGMGVNILWDADTDVTAFVVGADGSYTWDFSMFGGLTNNAGDGKTGDVRFTTVGATSGDTYSIVLEMVKSYA